MTSKHKHLWGVFCAIGGAMAYGAYPPAARAVYADGGNAAFVVVMATLARCLSLTLFCLVLRKKLFTARAHTKVALTGGFLQALTVICIFTALNILPGPVAIMIVFTNTIMLLLYSAWRGEEKLDGAVIATTLIALLGLSFVLDLWHHANHTNIWAMIMAFIAAVATMSRVYVYGQQSKTRDPAVIGAENFIFAIGFVVLWACFNHPIMPPSLSGMAWTAVACLAQIGGTFGMFYGIALLGSFQFSLLSKMEPIFTALFSVLFIQDILTWPQYAGMAIVILSLAQYQYATHRKRLKAKNQIATTL